MNELSLSFVQSPGLYCVEGRNEEFPRLGGNAVGKTSLLNALTWCLTGKTGDGVAGPKVVLRGHSTGQVQVQLSDGHTILRTQSPNSLTMDGKTYAPDSFASVFGASYELWMQAVHHAQGAALFVDLSPADRASVLSEILGLQIWDDLTKEVRKDLKRIAAEITEQQRVLSGKQGELSTIESQCMRLKSELNKAEELAQQAEEKRQEEILNLTVKVVNGTAQLDELKKQQQGLLLRSVRVEKQSVAASEKVTPLQAQCQEQATEMRLLERDRPRLIAELQKFERLGAECPTCGQKVSHEHKAEQLLAVRHKLETVEKELEQVRAFNLESSSSLAEAVSKTAELTKSMRSLQQETSEVNSEIRVVVFRIEKDQETLLALKDKPLAETHAAERLVTMLDEQNKRQRKVQAVVKELETNISTSLHAQDDYSYWSKTYPLVRLWLMEQSLQELTLLAPGFLAELGLEGWSMVFETQKATGTGLQQKLNVEVFPPGITEGCSILSFCGGERTRLRLAAQMALAAATAGSQLFGFEIWDEPSAYLSGSGLEDMLNILYNRAHRENKVIFLVDHTVPEFGFDGVLSLVRTKAGVTATWK